MKTSHLLLSGMLAMGAVLPAAAHNLVYTASLLGSNETIPNDSTGTGMATVTLDEHALTMRVQATFNGLGSSATMAHIHCCTASADTGNAGVAFPFADFPTGVTSGTYDHTFDLTALPNWSASFVANKGGTVEAALVALQQGLGSGKAYFNVHSADIPGGELRGNFTSAVPEPHSSLLMMMGLVGVGAVVHRRRSK